MPSEGRGILSPVRLPVPPLQLAVSCCSPVSRAGRQKVNFPRLARDRLGGIVQAAELPRKLGLLDATSVVAGTMIGSAIFIVPQSVAQSLPSTGMILLVWAVAGVLTFIAALAFAELGAMMPATGGQYVFLRESYGPFWAFLLGWALFLVIRSGSTAALAAGFSIYLSYLVPLTPPLSKFASVALIAVLTYVNYRGVRAGAIVQNLFTLLKLLGLALLIGSAFATRQPSAFEWSWIPQGFAGDQFGVALISCLWACQGWFVVSFVAGEVKEPQRNLPLSLGWGVAAAVSIYLLANIAYLKILSIPEIAATERVAATVAERTIGPLGAALVSLTIVLSIIGAANGGILAAPRVYFAQARDGLFFRRFGEIHPRFETPWFSILGQGIWASILALSGSYQKLFQYVIFASWIFYGMTVVGVILLRRRRPQVSRPYRMWGYPVTPVLFAAVTLWFVTNTLITTPGPSLMGLLIIATGVPGYFLWRRQRRQLPA